MGGVHYREGRQVAREILSELVLGCIPELQTGQVSDGDLLARLYLLRDTAAGASEMGAQGAAAAGWIARAAMLVRDEADRQQALWLLGHAAAHLAAAIEPHSARARRSGQSRSPGHVET